MISANGWAGVLFDLDGTLADTAELVLLSLRHTMEVHLGNVPPDDRLLATMGIPLPVALGQFARTDDEVLAMRATYRTFQAGVHDRMARPFPGTVAVVEHLRGRGVRLGIVTSKGGPAARRTMEVCGLWGMFDYIVTADEVVRGKPDPEPVLRALDGLGLGGRGRAVVFVGDAPVDLRSGRAAGTLTAAVSWGPHGRAALEAERPDYLVDRPEELLEIFAEGG